MRLRLIAIWAVISAVSWTAQADIIVQYTFPSAATKVATTTHADVTATDFDNGSAYSGSYEQGLYKETGNATASTTDPLENMATGNYFTFTVKADAGKVLNLSSFSFDFRRQSSGAAKVAVLSSVDDYASATSFNVGTSAATGGTTVGDPSVSLSGAAFQGLDEITFRVSFWGTNATSTSWAAVDDVTIQGAVVDVPEPAMMSLLGLGVGGLLARRRRR